MPRALPTLGPRTARASLARLIGWLVLVPVLILSGIGQGTMVEAAPEGGWRIVLCTGEGMIEAVMTADGRVHPLDEGPGDPDRTCDWAIHGQPLLAQGPQDLAPPHDLAATTVRAIDIPPHRLRASVLTPSARGPPPLA